MTVVDRAQGARPTTRRNRARSAAVIALVAVGAGGVAAVATTPNADCQTARTAISHISDHRELIASTHLKASPPVADYQGWATTLKQLAANATSPEIKSRLQHIADRAEHAMGLVALAKANPASDQMPSQTGIAAGFAQNVDDIVATEHELIGICHFG